MTNLAQFQAIALRPLRPVDRRAGTVRDAAAFGQQMRDWIKDVRTNYAPQVQRKIVAETFGLFVAGTPVGNPSMWRNPRAPKGYVGGHARRSWRIDVGTAQQGGQNSYTNLVNAKLTDRIVISNRAPYIERLNRGWSRQAPAGFLERAISTVATKYRRIK